MITLLFSIVAAVLFMTVVVTVVIGAVAFIAFLFKLVNAHFFFDEECSNRDSHKGYAQ